MSDNLNDVEISEKRHAQYQEPAVSKVNTYDADKALAVLEMEGGRVYTVDAKINKRIKRKVDMCLLPVMYFTYFLQYLDKTTLSYASIMGLQADTGLVGNQYSWLGTVFYFGYLIAEPLANRLMQKLPLGKFTAANTILWGIVLSCTAACHNFASLVVIRVLLGFFEASVSPAFVLFTTQYYRKNEQAGRMGVWWSANGLALVIGGCLAYGISVRTAGNQTAIASWQILFLAMGIVTALWGVGLWFLLPDDPFKAWFFSADDKIYSVERIRVNQQGVGNKHFKWPQCRETLKDPLVWLYFFYITISSIPQGALTSFFAIIINNFGYTAQESLLYASPSGAFFLGSVLICSFLADRIGQRIYMAIFVLCVALLGAALVVGLPATNKIGRLFGYYLTAVNAAPAILLLSCVATNTAGYTKKVTTNTIVFIGYAAGFIIGPQTFQAKWAPDYVQSKIMICVFLAVDVIVLLAIRIVSVQRNKHNAALRAEPGYIPKENSEFLDLTDRTNPEFIYAL